MHGVINKLGDIPVKGQTVRHIITFSRSCLAIVFEDDSYVKIEAEIGFDGETPTIGIGEELSRRELWEIGLLNVPWEEV